jgi:hypothetical protein
MLIHYSLVNVILAFLKLTPNTNFPPLFMDKNLWNILNIFWNIYNYENSPFKQIFQNLPCVIISISHNWMCEPLIKQSVLPKDLLKHSCIDALMH